MSVAQSQKSSRWSYLVCWCSSHGFPRHHLQVLAFWAPVAPWRGGGQSPEDLCDHLEAQVASQQASPGFPSLDDLERSGGPVSSRKGDFLQILSCTRSSENVTQTNEVKTSLMMPKPRVRGDLHLIFFCQRQSIIPFPLNLAREAGKSQPAF